MITHTPLLPTDFPPIPPVAATARRATRTPYARTLICAAAFAAMTLLPSATTTVGAQQPDRELETRDRHAAQLREERQLRGQLEQLHSEGEEVRDVIATQRDQIRILEEELQVLRAELRGMVSGRGAAPASDELRQRIGGTAARVEGLRFPAAPVTPATPGSGAPSPVASPDFAFPGLDHNVDLHFRGDNEFTDLARSRRRSEAFQVLSNMPFGNEDALVIDTDRAQRDFAFFGGDDLREMNSMRLVSRVFTEATVMMDQLHRVAEDPELAAIYAVQQIENIAPDNETALRLMGELSEAADTTTVRRAIDLKRAELMASSGDVDAALELYARIARGEDAYAPESPK